MSFNLQRILESKRALRRHLAARTVAEKLRMLDAMRERAVAIRAATPAAISERSAFIREESPDKRESGGKAEP